MSKKENISNERNEQVSDQDAATIHPRPAGPHHKPEHKPEKSGKYSFSNESQDADRHGKIRHEDSKK